MLPLYSPLLAVDQVETSRLILIAVCVAGVSLAYATDEAYSLLDGSLKKNKSSAGTFSLPPWLDLASRVIPKLYVETALAPCFWTWQQLQVIAPSGVAPALEGVKSRAGKFWKKARLAYSAYQLKRRATTKRHFFYLMEKQLLGLPILDGETEIDSYVDVKTYMGKKWPFMWEVSRVKGDKIDCAGWECYPMSSYSYLNLLRDSRVQEAAIAAAKEWSSGNHGPRMLGGNTSILCELERVIANFFGRDGTLLCATGYLACMSACAAIQSENCVIFADSRLHASLRAGLKLGDGKVVWFKHNDFKDCRAKILQWRRKYANSWMIIESVYSMDGDICDLPAAKALCDEFNISMMIDEAHGLGVLGKTGRGVEELYGLQGSATLIVGTFSKSIASIGGYITGPAKLISYLDFHAPGNVFSAPLPAYCAGAALKSFELIDAEPEIVSLAQQNSRKLREALETGGGHWPADYPESHKYHLEGDANSTVLPVVFPDDIDRVMRIATTLKHRGYMCSAVAYPACPLRRPRFRITATSAYTDELIGRFVKELVTACVQEPPSALKEIMTPD